MPLAALGACKAVVDLRNRRLVGDALRQGRQWQAWACCDGSCSQRLQREAWGVGASLLQAVPSAPLSPRQQNAVPGLLRSAGQSPFSPTPLPTRPTGPASSPPTHTRAPGTACASRSGRCRRRSCARRRRPSPRTCTAPSSPRCRLKGWGRQGAGAVVGEIGWGGDRGLGSQVG